MLPLSDSVPLYDDSFPDLYEAHRERDQWTMDEDPAPGAFPGAGFVDVGIGCKHCILALLFVQS
jgi:hypothetical protein